MTMPTGAGGLPSHIRADGPWDDGPDGPDDMDDPWGDDDGPPRRRTGGRNRSRTGSGGEGSTAPWLPPFRLGADLPTNDPTDARDLITGRGNKSGPVRDKQAAQLKRQLDTMSGSSSGGGGQQGSGNGPQSHRGSNQSSHQGGHQNSSHDATQTPVSGRRGAGSAGGGNRIASTLHDLDLGPAVVTNTAPRAGAARSFAQNAMTDPHPPPGSRISSWAHHCEEFVRLALGLDTFPGGGSASSAWGTVKQENRHVDRYPPAGVPVFFHTSDPNGHVALSDGNGYVYSTDIDGRGKVSRVPITQLEQKWGAKYLGWADKLGGQDLMGAGDHRGGMGSGAAHNSPSDSPNIAGGTTSNDAGNPKSIQSSTSSLPGPTLGHTQSPRVSQMPTTSGGMPTGLGSGVETAPGGLLPDLPGGRYSKGAIGRLWTHFGGDPRYAAEAAEIAYAESNGDPNVKPNHNSNGTIDWGLFQINSVNGGNSGDNDLATNVRKAVELFKGNGNRWWAGKNGPWTDPASEAMAKRAGQWGQTSYGRQGKNWPGWLGWLKGHPDWATESDLNPEGN